MAFTVTGFMLLVLNRNWGAISGVFALIIVAVVLWFTVGRALDLQDKMGARLSEGSLHTGEMRVQYWGVGVQGFLKRPLLGIGWGGFPGFAMDSSVTREAATHNIFVRILCELGIVGMGLFGAWIIERYLRLRRTVSGRLVCFVMTGVLLQGLLLDHFICTYFWLFLGLCDGAAAREPAVEEMFEEYPRGLAPRVGATAT